jgi:hypothetical protein
MSSTKKGIIIGALVTILIIAATVVLVGINAHVVSLSSGTQIPKTASSPTIYEFRPVASTSATSEDAFLALAQKQANASTCSGCVQLPTDVKEQVFNYIGENITAGVSSGFWVPTSASIPSGFKATRYLYTPTDYDFAFQSPSGVNTLEFQGHDYPGIYYLDVQTAYTIFGDATTFSYQSHPGLVFVPSATSSLEKSLSPGVESYELLWSDNGHVVEIDAIGFLSSQLSPRSLIDILETMTTNY